METVLTLTIGGLPPLSARGCEQILKPVQLGNLVRTVNGELIHVGEQGLKYQSIIRAKDRTVLAVNGLYPGVKVDVGCVQPLFEKMTDRTHTLMRPAVEGSIHVIDQDQQDCAFFIKNDKIYLSEKTTKDVYVSYRPILSMRVTDFLIRTNEWTFESSWELFLEEI